MNKEPANEATCEWRKQMKERNQEEKIANLETNGCSYDAMLW